MKFSLTFPLILVFASCSTVDQQGDQSSRAVAGTQKITLVSHTTDGVTEVKKLIASDREVVVSLSWRKYSAALDSSISEWYGDMARPPAKYVAKSLSVTIDERRVEIPESKYRYLGSQWMNDIKQIGVLENAQGSSRDGDLLYFYINLGDGSESWVASYAIDLVSGVLVSHEIHDAVSFHNGIGSRG